MMVLQRRWSDLKLRQMFLGLALAPMPAVAMILAGVLAAEQPSFARFLWYSRVLLECTAGWGLLAGSAWLFGVLRWRKRMTRLDCLVMGVVMGLLFPYGVIAVRHFAPVPVLDWLALKPDHDTLQSYLPDWTQPADYAVGGACLAFGLLGGWIFWGVAVRPAPLPPPDAAVFE